MSQDVGLIESLSALPPLVLSAVFGVLAETFNSFKKIDSAIVILRSP
jgi:oxalate decarboxylase